MCSSRPSLGEENLLNWLFLTIRKSKPLLESIIWQQLYPTQIVVQQWVPGMGMVGTHR
jgi:hypothetical protein